MAGQLLLDRSSNNYMSRPKDNDPLTEQAQALQAQADLPRHVFVGGGGSLGEAEPKLARRRGSNATRQLMLQGRQQDHQASTASGTAARGASPSPPPSEGHAYKGHADDASATDQVSTEKEGKEQGREGGSAGGGLPRRRLMASSTIPSSLGASLCAAPAARLQLRKVDLNGLGQQAKSSAETYPDPALALCFNPAPTPPQPYTLANPVL